MKLIALIACSFLAFGAQAQVIDTLGPKNPQQGTRGPRNQNTNPIVKPTRTDTVKRQEPGSTFPVPGTYTPPTTPPVPHNNTAPGGTNPPPQNNTSPPTPQLPGRPNTTP